jgi:DNA-binding HxlR family transcriptional regulator
MKIAKTAAGMGRRKYDGNGCGAAHALDLVGDRWALLVVRELLLGPKRFTDVLAGLPGASPDMITQRLRELEETGVVRRRQLPPPTPAWVYELTAWGAQLEGTLLALGRWGGRSPAIRLDATPGVDAFMLRMKAMFNIDAAKGLRTSIALKIDNEWFEIQIIDQNINIRRSQSVSPDVSIEGNLAAMDALLRTAQPLEQILAAHKKFSPTETQAIEHFRQLFKWPEMASLPERT